MGEAEEGDMNNLTNTKPLIGFYQQKLASSSSVIEQLALLSLLAMMSGS